MGKAKRSGTTSPLVPKPRATCSITDGLFDGFEFVECELDEEEEDEDEPGTDPVELLDDVELDV